MERSEALDCPYCDKTFPRPNDLYNHARMKHGKRRTAHLKPEEDESMGALFRAWRDHLKEQRRENLKRADSTGWKVHCETHWSQDFLGHRLDYWPSRNKFRYRGRTMTGDVVGFMRNRLVEVMEEFGSAS